MLWRGRKQSKNVEDKTGDPPPYIPDGTIMFGTGEVWKNKPDDKDAKVAKELGRLNREKKTPIPTPRPSDKHDRIQVTPGKWTTK